METKVNALMIKSVDYKDNDKMLTLYSLEKGKIGAGIKGVKKAGAKLTFCTMPFCFAEYVLNVKGDRYSVTGASEIESFYKIRLNVSSYYLAGGVSEFLIKFTEDGEVNERLFYLAVNALKSLCFDADSPEKAICVFINFWAGALGAIGYAADFFNCGFCGERGSEKFAKTSENRSERAFFDFSAGKRVCESCYSAGNTGGVSEIMPSTLNAVEYALSKNLSDVTKVPESEEENEENGGKNGEFLKKGGDAVGMPEKGDFLRALMFFNHYTRLKLGDGLKTVADYIKLGV